MPKKQNKKKTAKRDSSNEPQGKVESQPAVCSYMYSIVRSSEQGVAGVPVVLNIAGGNIQVGNYNVMQANGREDSSIEIGNASNLIDHHKKTYAEALTGSTRIHIESKGKTERSQHVYIPLDHEIQSDIEQSNRSNIGLFLEKVNNFERGHFVLVTGEQFVLHGIDALAHINWTAVFDFDPHSRSKGMLSRLEPIISKFRSLHVSSIQDSFAEDTFAETKTNWVFFRGCADRPDTRLPNDFNEWKKLSNESIEDKLKLLKQFELAYTCITFVVIWPTNDESVQYMHSVLNRICTSLKSSVLILDNGNRKSKLSERKLEDVNDNDEVFILKLGILDMCTGCSSVIKTLENEDHCYSLPMIGGHIKITDDKVQWLKEDLHVLYLNNTTRVKHSGEDLAKLEDDFRKGGTLTWDWLYAGGAGHADIERDDMPNIKRRLRMYITKREPGQVTILHEPGAGGTTLGRKLLWELKEETPCVEIINESITHITDQIEKLAFLEDMTNCPIVALIDGDDETRVKTLRKLARRDERLCLIVLYLRRTTSDDVETTSKNDFYLKGQLSKCEARMLELKCKKCDMDDMRLYNVRRLVSDVETDEPRTIFEFGLAAHSYEYEGIQSYVLNYLKLKPESSEIENWQKALAYISLVYFYGHSPVPCHFFTNMLAESVDKSILQVDDFPKQMHELIVPGENRMFVRISHFYVAKAILEQSLLRMRPVVSRPLRPYLCNEARRLLGDFSSQFISTAVDRSNGNVSDAMTRLMIDTFIRRDTKELPDDETTETRKEGTGKPLFSHILEDAGSNPPYTERLNILQTLADGFPAIPQFRAHLGRFFMICRPEAEIEAEKHFASAYEKSTDNRRKLNELPYSKRNEIRNICHMYGKMISRKVFKHTGKFAYDRPSIHTNEAQFEARAMELFQNVLKACELFEKCREISSQGYEECNGYMDEIHVRLAYCRFIQENEHSPEWVLSEIGEDIAQFIEDCDRTVIELFDELYDISECRKNEKILRLREMYKKVMCSEGTHLRVPISPLDNPESRRNEIVTIKHKYFDKGSHKYLETLQDEVEISRIVTLCEKNFETIPENDSIVDLDYKEWIKAIRHPVYPKQETVESVNSEVRYWYDRLTQNCTGNKGKQTVALFYHFVMTCLLGFGSVENPGNADLLKQALRLMIDIKFTARWIHNGDCRREWLGIPGSFKQRLVEGNKWNNLTVDVPEEMLEIRVGTIIRPNNRDSSGYIDLFVGDANKESVRVNYTPERWGTKGRSFGGKRVQFVVQFNMKRGLEAFNVKLVGRTECDTPGCGNNIETRSCDKEVTCCNCLKKTEVKSA